MKDKYSLSAYQSLARTATPTAVEVTDRVVKGIQVVINTTATAATPSVVPTIDGYDALSDTWYNILTAAAVTGTGSVILRIHPDLVSVTNETAADFLPAKYRIVMTHGDADSITYSVSVNSTSE